MLVCTCQYIYIRLCRKCAVFLLYPCRSSTVNESIQGSGICEDELRFSPLTHTLQYAGFFFSSSSFAFTSKPWKGSHFWPDSLSVFFFFLWKCDVLFISYVRPNPTHDIFVIFGGVRICCMQVATFSWQCENQNSQPSCLCFFLLFTYTSQSCEHRRQQRVYECSPLVAANISTVQNILQWTSLQHIPAWRVW